ncbi:hypothetical protein P245_20910 [Comamonas thiooxydans]|uniref:Uncharacterized protein n=1 Tax=Comamonas thiooxydans TaxID=363952 RepID=A0A0E3BXM8_9BURK|nr:hypothetical protein P245_20910 [Comamonas thiooxydans]
MSLLNQRSLLGEITFLINALALALTNQIKIIKIASIDWPLKHLYARFRFRLLAFSKHL